jgi:hypothetical protein
MKLFEETFQHPTQASRVRLRLFQQPEGFLATEEWQGATTVYRTLGLFDSRPEAEAAVAARSAQLVSQRFQPVAAAA